MSKTIRICKVCGKPYEYCYTRNIPDDTFRWQNVACCPEHGMQYFKMIEESRKAVKDEDRSKDKETIIEIKNIDNDVTSTNKDDSSIETESVKSSAKVKNARKKKSTE